MPRLIIVLAAIVLGVHGLVHLMGTAVYMKLAQIQGLTYKTTLLGGRWDLGEGGIRVFGALWMPPAIGFMAAAVALAAGWGWWQPLLVAATLFSLGVTALDWSNAYAGVFVNIAILAVVWLGPRVASWFSQ